MDVVASCLCRQVHETVHLAAPALHKKPICHCSSCRHATGVLFLSVLPLEQAPNFVSKLRKYDSSSKISRYFCPTCGTHLLCHVAKDDAWDLCAGAVDKFLNGGDTLEQYISGHEFIDDTLDGGLGVCLTNANGRPLDLFLQGPDEAAIPRSDYLSRLEHISEDLAVTGQKDMSGQLRASCHCGGVQYCISRPSLMSQRCSSPWPDLIVPSQSGHSDNRDDVKWWLRAKGTKYLAGTCACRSCRLASGVPVQAWAFVPKANLHFSDGSQFHFASGTLEQYSSSEGVYREFCGVCGATAFWHCETRPDLIDVSVGLLRAPEGARALSWLDWWTDRVSFKEDALDKQMIGGLEEGLAALRN